MSVLVLTSPLKKHLQGQNKQDPLTKTYHALTVLAASLIRPFASRLAERVLDLPVDHISGPYHNQQLLD